MFLGFISIFFLRVHSTCQLWSLFYLDLSFSNNDKELFEKIVINDWITMYTEIMIGQIIILLNVLNKLVPMTKHFIAPLSHLKWSVIKQAKKTFGKKLIWNFVKKIKRSWCESSCDITQHEWCHTTCRGDIIRHVSFFYKIFFWGIFLEIHHDHIQCRFNVIFAQLGF